MNLRLSLRKHDREGFPGSRFSEMIFQWGIALMLGSLKKKNRTLLMILRNYDTSHDVKTRHQIIFLWLYFFVSTVLAQDFSGSNY